MLARGFALLLGLVFWCTAALADSLPEAQRDLFISFARDVSGDDPVIMAKIKTLVETSPTTLEEIGFYGLEGAPAPERTLRGIISALTNAGHLIAIEDKYANELGWVLVDQDLAQADGDEAMLDPGSFFDGVDWENGAEPDWPGFAVFFVEHIKAIETAVARKGYRLLSVRLPLGDTLYFWAVPDALAETWTNRALYSGVNTQPYLNTPLVTISVTKPDWKSYWGVLTYALQIPEDHAALPEGL
ncbi:hypothetical protein [Roseovarius sp. 2305UL8-3]|uniref:hypothetical protein n=1 Tax=Roseovarius conchicola TaxID=3121636 RepID=UPI00352883A0